MKGNDKDAQRSIFDLTPEQRAARLQRVTDQVKQATFAKGLPLVYQDERCPTEDHFIHEYEDGRTYLMILDIDSRKYTLVKDLTNA
jgi:hypothetical protein